MVGLGLEIGVDHLVVRAADLGGAQRHQALVVRDNRDRPVDAVLDDLAGLAREALAALAAEKLLTAGAVVALPGLVNSSDGCLLVAPNLGWTDVYVPELLAERLGAPAFPIRAENEANLGALAELWEGAGRRFRDFLYISGDIGVGAGIIVDGELFRGAHGFGGELGHVTVDPDGELCACGSRGCVETRVALDALLRDSGLAPDAGVAALAERAEAGDERALAALAEAGRWLGVGVASAVNLLNPSGVVIGGYFATLASWLAPGLEQELGERVLSAHWDLASVVTLRAGRRGRRARRGGGRAAPRLRGPRAGRGALDNAARAAPRRAAGRAPRWHSRAARARRARRPRAFSVSASSAPSVVDDWPSSGAEAAASASCTSGSASKWRARSASARYVRMQPRANSHTPSASSLR